MKHIYNGMTLTQLIKALAHQQKRAEAWKQEAIARGWKGFPLKKAAVLIFALLAFSGIAQASSVSLSWSEPTTTVPYAFNLYRIAVTGTSCPAFVETGTGAWTQIVGSIPGAQTTQSDTTIVVGTSYCYAVTAYATDGSQGETAPSNLFFITAGTVAPVSNKLPVPTGLTGTFVQ